MNELISNCSKPSKVILNRNIMKTANSTDSNKKFALLNDKSVPKQSEVNTKSQERVSVLNIKF